MKSNRNRRKTDFSICQTGDRADVDLFARLSKIDGTDGLDVQVGLNLILFDLLNMGETSTARLGIEEEEQQQQRKFESTIILDWSDFRASI